MKLVGLNTFDLEEDGVTDEVKVYHGEELIKIWDGLFPASYVNREEYLRELAKLDKIYIEIFNSCNSNTPKTQKLEIVDNQIMLRKGLAIHNMSKDDSIDNIYERLLSISKYGLLPIEWFGLYYGENEVKYMVSAHRVREDVPIVDMEICPDPTADKKEFKKMPSFNLIIDYENPILEPLKNFANINTAFVRSYIGRVNDNEGILKQRIEEDVEYNFTRKSDDFIEYIKKHNVVIKEIIDKHGLNFLQDNTADFKKEFYKKTRQFFTRSINNLFDFISRFGTNFSEENLRIYRQQMIDETKEERVKRVNERVEKYKKMVKIFQEYNCYLYGGIPPQLIIGITLPNYLAEKIEFVEKVQQLFPQATIINEKGCPINTRQLTQKNQSDDCTM